jgi:hypothetical protein
MDTHLDQFMEDHINGGYGPILDELAAQETAEYESVCPNCEDEGCEFCDFPENDVPLDGDHDSAMASAGWGTDEDYGFFGGDEDW